MNSRDANCEQNKGQSRLRWISYRLCRLLLLLLLSQTLPAYAACDGLGGSGGDCSGGSGIYYTTNNGFATVTRILGLSGQAETIPGTLGGVPVISIAASAFASSGITGVTIPNTVTNIGEQAFYSCASLTNVTMGSGVTHIGPWAFSSCTSLTNIIMSDGLTSIGDNAFNYCTALASFTIPNSVTNIGDGAFGQCSSLTNVTIGSGVTHVGNWPFFYCQNLMAITVDPLNSNYHSANGVLFDKEQTTLIQFPGGKSGGYTVPNSVTNIVASACYGSTKLTSVSLSTNLARMGDWAFSACGLTNITIPNSVTSIGLGTFQLCSFLTRAVIGNRVAGIRNETFLNCVNLKSVTIGTNVTSIGDYAFSGCTSLMSITIPNGTTNLGSYAFNYCYNLTNVTIPNGVIGIGDWAFDTCQSLTRVVFPPSLKRIGEGAFNVCVNLTNVTISEGLRSIGDGAFNSCGLKTVTLPGSVTNIGLTVFRYCYPLAAITVSPLNPAYASSNGVLFNKGRTVLIQYPIARAGSYTIPGTVTNIGPFSFAGASLLTNVVIPSGVTRIERAAFASGVGLTSLSLPDSVVHIGESAFSDCDRMTDLVIGRGVEIIGDAAFYHCASLTNLTIPDGVKHIGQGAFYWCPSLAKVTVSKTVTTIGASAFANCAALQAMYFLGNAPVSGSAFGFYYPRVYYLPGTTGWGPSFDGATTALWLLPKPLIVNFGPSFGVRTNRFGFIVSWATNLSVAVEACTNLAVPVWSPLATNTLPGGWFYFSDPEWTNYPSRIYRVRAQ